MPTTQSLDELIARKAAEFADQLRHAAALADKEEEIRIEVERQLAFIEREAGVKLEGRHEFTIAQGRADSVYTRVLIEYKNPSSPASRLGPRGDSPGSKKVVEQIKERFHGLRDEHHQPLTSLFGVGFDGKYFIFVRFRDGKWEVQEPEELSKHSAKRFLWALFNLGQKGKPFSPEYLAGDFGAHEHSLAIPGVHALYDAIVATDHPKAQTFFNQWKILFGEVCGYDVENPSDKIKKLAESYGVAARGLKPAELLFALHTYYALFMKLLASQVVSFFHNVPPPPKKMLAAGTSAKLKREMEELERGSIFPHLNITNFLEGDLFTWYTAVWADPIERLVRRMVSKLDEYNPGTMSEDPVTSRDLLKKLYQQLFPKSVRHDLGEYYTADWLAEHVLNELGYVGDPDTRLLDPACGSGTFLVMAINRIKKWFEDNREQIGYDEGELCQKILANVIGFDLNPLAVMAARTNYLIAIRDLVGHVGNVEIPVYLCDSIMTPSEYGLFAGTSLGKAKALRTAAANFTVPAEIATNREDVAKYAEQLEFAVRNGYSSREFVQLCREEGLPITVETLHAELYEQLVNLNLANRNSVWARIIKNAFAPLYVGRFDYVAGNPPWINWENLPEDYREQVADLWKKYQLFAGAAKVSRLRSGRSKADVAGLMLYVAADSYLKPQGKLGLLLTQTLLRTDAAGHGFRRFTIRSDKQLKPLRYDDLSALQVFEGATNRAAILFLRAGGAPTYPVQCRFWVSAQSSRIPADLSLTDVQGVVRQFDWGAEPIASDDTATPWITARRATLLALRKCKGVSPYHVLVRERVNTRGANGVYWVDVLQQLPGNELLVQNQDASAKKRVGQNQAAVDRELVFPLCRGRDIKRWQITSKQSIVVPYLPGEGSKPLSEPVMKQRYSSTFAFLNLFRKILAARKKFRNFDPHSGVFYEMYNVGEYTFLPHKVIYKGEVSTDLVAAVGSSQNYHGRRASVIPDQTAHSIGFDDQMEAHYFCALFNSLPARCLYGALCYKHPSTFILKYIGIPRYQANNPAHAKLATLSLECHKATARNERDVLTSAETEIDQLAATLWSITASEFRAIQASMKEMHKLAGKAPQSDEE
jgi:methylase of polypeptide subunit release factors